MQIDEKAYSTSDIKRDIAELKFENRVQTIAVVLFFFFGVATIMDLKKIIK